MVRAMVAVSEASILGKVVVIPGATAESAGSRWNDWRGSALAS
jgi:hypothetical protein